MLQSPYLFTTAIIIALPRTASREARPRDRLNFSSPKSVKRPIISGTAGPEAYCFPRIAFILMCTRGHMTISSVVSILTFALGAFTSLGFYKYYLEPLQAASALRKKYGTAVWIACKELDVHLTRVKKTLGDYQVFVSLLKIPANDWQENIDWFTKDGFYSMVTAHKIAQVSAWIYIYQQELLFSRARKSRELLEKLYSHASAVRKAFSEGSCLWPEYFNGVGSQYIEALGEFSRPLSFSAFCFRCASDKKFHEQLHMFIHLMAKDEREPGGRHRIDDISGSLRDLMTLLEDQKLLAGVKTAEIGQDIVNRTFDVNQIAR